MENKFNLLSRWLQKERGFIYRIYALALIQGAIYLAIPLSVQGVITYTMAGRFSASLVLLSLITILATGLIGFFQLWQMRINETLQQKIFAGITDNFHAGIPLADRNKIGNKILYFFEISTLQKGIGKILLDFSFSIISIVFGLLILPAYSNWFLIFAILLSAAFYLVVTYYGKKAQEANLETSNYKYKVFESISYGEGDTNNELDHYIEARKNYFKIFESQYKGILLFKIFFVAVLLLLGIYLVQAGALNIGQFVASEIIILLVINSVEKLVGSLETFYDITTGLYKIRSVFKDGGEQLFHDKAPAEVLPAALKIYIHRYGRVVRYAFYFILVTTVIILFLPWTQTVSMDGTVSVLDPENKPQQVTSRIGGRVEKWFIKDGDFVKKNDTIAFISEIKEEYMDTLLVSRSESQVKAKEVALQAYEKKIQAIDEQIDALNTSLRLKVSQGKNKIIQVRAKLSSDSTEAEASRLALRVAEEQFKRYDELLTKGVISKTDHENRRIKLQESQAKRISAENKVIGTRNELFNSELELNGVQQEYNEKLMKAESDKFSTLSLLYDSQGSLAKLQSQLSGYSLRNSYYYVLAPQDGYIQNIVIKGLGEIVKEGGMLCSIVPHAKEQVVELYVDPIDLPLIRKGDKVNLVFDGWPSFVFTGWPGMSYGAFHAEIISFDKAISPNGKFRVLAANHDAKWPEAVQIGGGAKGFALLRDVPLIYELWRKANGFPPEFYETTMDPKHEAKSKK